MSYYQTLYFFMLTQIRKGIFLCLLFAGSVFITSGKFVDVQNAPKFYFAVIFFLVLGLFLALNFKSHIVIAVISNKSLFWSIFAICILQSLLGLSQYVGFLPSKHSNFAISGSFDNPAGFAAVLAMGFPIGLFLLAMGKKDKRYLAASGLMVIVLAVFLSEARTSILSIIISSLAFFLFQKNILSKFQHFKCYKLLSILVLALFLSGTFILYQQKKDSANGRLLIWQVSLEMIKDRPLFGHGYGSFQAKYMDYQAEYFKNNPNSEFELLADNVKHPFNEFIKVAVEFGMIGLVTILLFILFVLWKIIISEDEGRGPVLSGLVAFLILANFSYPLQYVAIWLLLAFYLLILLPSTKIVIKNVRISIFTRSVIVIACVFFIVYTYRQIRAEIKWKAIAVSSLDGNTGEMLPEYEKLYLTSLKQSPLFLYNYGAELNVAGKFDKSVEILTECKKHFNDYDLQMLLADNYYKLGELGKAILTYQHASYMIPCRFLPLYQLFKIYEESGQTNDATKCANEIINKKVKIPSLTIKLIILEVEEFIEENKSTFGNKNYMSSAVSVFTGKQVAYSNGVTARQENRPQSATAYSPVR